MTGLALWCALLRALWRALAAVTRLAIVAPVIALRRHAHGRPPGLRHVFLHALWIALLPPLLFIRKNIGLFIGSLVEGGRGIGLAIWLAIGWAVWLAVPLVISGAVALPAIALIAVSIVVAARRGLPLGIALTL